MDAGLWTAQIVNEHLIQAFRTLPGHAVFSSRNSFTSIDGPPQASDAFSWAPRFLATYPRARLHLYAWARCRASGSSWKGYCRMMGWTKSTADASRTLAATIIAEGLNAADATTESRRPQLQMTP